VRTGLLAQVEKERLVRVIDANVMAFVEDFGRGNGFRRGGAVEETHHEGRIEDEEANLNIGAIETGVRLAGRQRAIESV